MGGESEKIVNELDNTFQQKGITLVRDKRDLGFKGEITNFMNQIGTGRAVVVVISDKYLKSPYCMYELLEIYRNLKFKERIFPIVLGDANIFEPIPRLQYLKHWQLKKQELDDAIRDFGTDAITVIGDDYKTYKKVFDNFGEVINILKDINSLTPQMHRDDNFQIMFQEIEKLLNINNISNSQKTENSENSEKKKRIDTSLTDITDFRKKSLLQRLENKYKLLDEYENLLMLSQNPKERMMCENEIENINKTIEKIETDLNKL